jgi:hypothetical protein
MAIYTLRIAFHRKSLFQSTYNTYENDYPNYETTMEALKQYTSEQPIIFREIYSKHLTGRILVFRQQDQSELFSKEQWFEWIDKNPSYSGQNIIVVSGYSVIFRNYSETKILKLLTSGKPYKICYEVGKQKRILVLCEKHNSSTIINDFP